MTARRRGHAATLGAAASALLLAACADPPPPTPPAPRALLAPPGGRFDVDRQAIPAALSSLSLGDCNADGLLDAVALGGGLRVLVQRAGGRFEPAAEVPFAQSPQSTALFDEDDDGVLDLVVAGDGARVSVLRGLGDCRFERPRELAPATTGEASQVMVTDVDLDGLEDLVVNRRAVADGVYRLLLARGDGTWEERPPPSLPAAPAPARGHLTFFFYYADIDEDGALDLFGLIDLAGSWLAWGTPGEPRRFDTDPALSERLVRSCAMSVSALDFDRDGRTDWYLSGTARANLLFRGAGPRRLVEASGPANIRGGGDTFSWGSYALDADLDGWQDLLVLQEAHGPSFEGVAAPVWLWMNQRDGTFFDWGDPLVNTNVLARSLACGDLASDGHVGCVAMDPSGAVLLRNRVEPAGHWLGMRLRGTVSVADGSGATVSIDGASPPQVVRVGAQVGVGGHHAPDVLLAVGSRERVDATVTWPSGLRQTLRDLPADRYAVAVEPQVLTVSSRVAPADGRSRVEVAVDADAAGASGFTLSRSGAGEWDGPGATGPDGRFRRALVAPASAGEARIELSLDGVALRVRPLIRFR